MESTGRYAQIKVCSCFCGFPGRFVVVVVVVVVFFVFFIVEEVNMDRALGQWAQGPVIWGIFPWTPAYYFSFCGYQIDMAISSLPTAASRNHAHQRGPETLWTRTQMRPGTNSAGQSLTIWARLDILRQGLTCWVMLEVRGRAPEKD